MDVPAISSERLELVSLSSALLQALLEGRDAEVRPLLGAAPPAGWPDAHDARFLRLRLAQIQREPEVQEWLVRGLVRREGRPALVGTAGFHGTPGVNGPGIPAAVEVGYTIFPRFRGRGYATEAAKALIAWARETHGIRHFVASVAPGNAPSLAVVRKLGFVRTGEQWDDEDGLEHVFELRADGDD